MAAAEVVPVVACSRYGPTVSVAVRGRKHRPHALLALAPCLFTTDLRRGCLDLVPNLVPGQADVTRPCHIQPRAASLYLGKTERQGANRYPRVGQDGCRRRVLPLLSGIVANARETMAASSWRGA